MARTVLKGNLVLPDRLMHGTVVIESGKIVAVEPGESGVITDDWGDCYIAPGFIDIHVHGIAGADTMDGSDASLAKMASQLAKHGVTGFLPTTVTHDLAITLRAVETIRAYMDNQFRISDGAAVLGIHLEGPWISPDARGAQNGNYILPPDLDTVQRVVQGAGGTVRKVTLAPELEGADTVIRWLRQSGIYVSIGHTTATYEQAEHAVELGATHVTHCYNAMSGLHHRKPGVVGAALVIDELYAEMIADGVHVHPAAMKLVRKVKGREKVALISDAIAAADMPDGVYDLGGLAVTVKNGQARLADGTLAGSTLTLDRAVRNMVQLCGTSLVDAVYMASTAPAAAIGYGNRKGAIQPGFDADLVVLDSALAPIRTYLSRRL